MLLLVDEDNDRDGIDRDDGDDDADAEETVEAARETGLGESEVPETERAVSGEEVKLKAGD